MIETALLPLDLRRRDARFAAVLQEAFLASRVYEGDARLQKKRKKERCRQRAGMRCRQIERAVCHLTQRDLPFMTSTKLSDFFTPPSLSAFGTHQALENYTS